MIYAITYDPQNRAERVVHVQQALLGMNAVLVNECLWLLDTDLALHAVSDLFQKRETVVERPAGLVFRSKRSVPHSVIFDIKVFRIHKEFMFNAKPYPQEPDRLVTWLRDPQRTW